MEYPFHRDCYDLIEESIKKHSVTFLLGPRKTGKTVCMKQLYEAYDNSIYYDFKEIPNEQHLDIFCGIYDAILNKEDRLILLDEITYVDSADLKIYEIACKYTDVINDVTKIVITGSQSVALGWWMGRAYAGNVGNVRVDFLTYSEFLRYKNMKEINPDTYNRFLFEVADFYRFDSFENYLRDCVEETIISNMKASDFIYDNNCDLLKDHIDVLVDICYQTMSTLYNIRGTLYSTHVDSEEDFIITQIKDSLINSYNKIQKQDIDILRQAFVFLNMSDLITVTSVSTDLNNVPDAYCNIKLDRNGMNCKKDLFNKFNVTINYPMFYVRILQDILKQDMPQKLSGSLLDSVVECHARGLLPRGFTYCNVVDDKLSREYEIDYINYSNLSIIEFIISNEHFIHSDILPDYMKCICLTKDKNYKKGNITYKDYCSFLYELSQSEEVTQKKVKPLFDVFK